MTTIKKSVSFNLCPNVHIYENDKITETNETKETNETNEKTLEYGHYLQPTFSLNINIPKDMFESTMYESTIKYNKSTLSPLIQNDVKLLEKNNTENYTNAFYQNMSPDLLSSSSIEKYFQNLNMGE